MPTISRTLLLLTLLGLGASSSCTKAKSERLQRGDLQIQVAVQPDPPTPGENRVLLDLRDATGKPVEEARIDFVYDMPAMGSMPEMKGGGDVHAKGSGKYEVHYPLSMPGDWTLSLRIQAEGHAPAELRMKVSPPRKGFTLEGQGGTSETVLASGSSVGKVLDVPPQRQQLIGVTYGAVERRRLSLSLRATGRVEVDESQVGEVTLKYDAYIEKLYVSQTGQSVKRGDPLLAVYSPDLLSAEQDLILARRNLTAGTMGAEELVRAAEERLRLWDLTPEQLKQLERRGTAEPRVTIRSPISGVVLEKNVVAGSRAMAGYMLYRIGNLGRVWVVADMYEADATHVRVGQPAAMSMPSLPGQEWGGRLSFVYPTVDEKTRSIKARLSFENANFAFKPGMFVDVKIEVPLGERLSVPDSALLLSGEHRYAFVDRGPGKLQPVEVETGVLAGEFDEVWSGLKEGDRVATGATFLLSSEAQLRNALPRWSAP